MITLIEIDGFKTFKDFKVELAPFQVIVGMLQQLGVIPSMG